MISVPGELMTRTPVPPVLVTGATGRVGRVVDMLLAAWGATTGTPAFVTSTVFDILGSAPRSCRQRVADHAAAFTAG
jgi:NADPH:quinone reductase-like Zn-dependent oxidoreductase